MRAALACLATLLPLVLAALAAAAAAPAPAAAEPAGVRVLECTSALDPAARSVTFEGRMRMVRRSATMAMRFALQTRGGDEPRWRRLPAEGFDAWLVSDPAVRRYTFAKTVRGLLVPASYRAVVRFRWLDAAGEVVGRGRSVSAACAQPDLRPDLVVRRLDVLPLVDGEPRRYAVQVRNAGPSAAAESAVRVDVNGGGSVSVAVPALAPGQARRVVVDGPDCVPGATVAAVADAGAAVDERDEAANVIAVPCPE